MGAEDKFFEEMDATASADIIRARQYNRMIKELGVAFEMWAVNLSHTQRKEIYDALDWYHVRTDAQFAIERDGKVVFQEVPDGKWPAPEMSAGKAKEKFDRLRGIEWLKLDTECS